MLTDKAVRPSDFWAAAKDKAYKLNGSGGLNLHVSPKAHKSRRFKYRFEPKEQLLTIGTCPLAAALEQRDDARKLLREGRSRVLRRSVESWWVTLVV